MALKPIVTATEHGQLAEGIQNEYILQADGTFKLDLGPGQYVTDKDPAGLLSALENEREETKKVRAKADELEQKALEAEREGMKSVEEIRESFRKELEERDKRAEAERKKAEKQVKEQQERVANAAKSQKALEIASSLFGKSAPVVLPHVEAQLQAVPGDNPTVQIIDPVTKQPVLDQNFDNFKKSLSTNELFAPMVVVSQASGSSANDGGSSGLPSSTNADGKPKTYKDFSPPELLALKREQPDLFRKLKSEFDSSKG